MQWIKSTYSNGSGGDCVEWAPAHAAATGIVPVRDSKNPTGPTLHLTATTWTTFLTTVKKGDPT